MAVFSSIFNGPYIPPFRPLSNITPFTYRDGSTYLEILEDLRTYVNTTIVDFINTNFGSLDESFTEEVTSLITQFEAGFTAQDLAVSTQLTEHNTAIQTLATELTNYVNTTVAGIIEDSVEANDPIVEALINNVSSLTRIALDSIFQNAGSLDPVITGMVEDEESTTRVALDLLYGNQAPSDSDIATLVNNTEGVTRTALDGIYTTPDNITTLLTDGDSPQNDAVIALASDVMTAGTPGNIKITDARTNLSIARPTWAGSIVWLVDVGDPAPTNIIDGDFIWEVTEVDWSPIYLPNVLVWYDAQSLGLADAAAVSTWPDSGPNSRDMAQVTADNRPVVDIDKINGNPAVVFDGTDDYMTATLASEITGGSYTVYIVAGTDLADNAANSDFLLGGGNAANNTGRLDIYRGTSEQFWMQRSGSIGSAASAWTTGHKLIKATFNGASSGMTVDGVSQVAGSTSSTTVGKFLLGARADATNFFTGYIGEIIIISDIPSTENDTKIIDYLTDRWGL